jgi:hypothetical protein
MSEFLVEAYHPSAALDAGDPGPHHVASAAEDVAGEGREVILLRAILVPEDETCFYLFRATGIDAVLESMDRSGLPVLRALPAVSAWVAPEAGPSRTDEPTSSPSQGKGGTAPHR